ncbi:large subunit ribosomal protein L15 [Catalinimonas alkaloidigena]|uniref:50S ribosomal protein L15 n=1 Tax=Catalinimonas alkaloidigena TaxID=1075417 RepID=UPI0024050CAE|nr:50S ribosomal protein L15 [Catalinimonas alkaloidigena]MDF9795565.1 large subunit ribosomal protein L15 [Catalinimonas alkaloidigena]
MNLHTIKPAQGSVKTKKRLGRGAGSGFGGTASRGHKGAKSRSGYKTKAGFEGGQMPLQRRVPKFGFRNPNRTSYSAINIDQLQRLSEKSGETSFTLESLHKHGLVGKNDKVKVLGNGELSAKIEVEAHAFSASAEKAIEAVGGSVKKL